MSRVNKALRDLWGDASGRSRASLLNFAIYSENPARLERNTETLAALTREHACRSLLILNVPDAPESQTRAWITAHCQLYDGKKSVCCEQLSFVIEGGSADQVRSTIFANLDSDLPLVLWWQGDINDRLDERFVSAIDGLIFDSSEFIDASKAFARVLEAKANRSAHFALSDLAWMRSHFMRTALAGECSSPRVLESLPAVNKLSIVHSPGHVTTALMMAAWIGTQLKCKLEPGLKLVRASGSAIQIVLAEGALGCPVQAVALSGEDISVAVRRDPGSCFAHATLDHPDQQHEQVQPADLGDDASLIAEQLSRLGGATRYFEMLPLLLDLLKQRIEQ